MPSLEESKRRVKDSLEKQHKDDIDHDAILASLQDEIDRHNAVKDDARASIRKSRRTDDSQDSERSMKFRFKASADAPRKRKKHSSKDEERSHRKRKRKENYPTPPEEQLEESTSAHPFPREPVDPTESEADPNAAFRTSLFDALADDEGAAYWESVYSQPIHVYPRPSVETPQGTLEAMSDDDYAQYVKTKMWERKHPELVQERRKKDKERKEEEEMRTRRREEFIRRRERAAWERAQGWKGKDDEDEDSSLKKGYEYEFAGNPNRGPSDLEQEKHEYASAWAEYSTAWDKLKYDLLSERTDPASDTKPPSKRIPWPVLASQAVIKANIEAFMQHAPTSAERSKVQVLKAERVRWHPDKIQQRFAGGVDEGTMRIVTGVFQVVDALLESARGGK